jgi:glycogen debranching enzyme
VQALRARLQRALLATLLLSQGTPMLAAGDELGHSQQGNNNAYCQDNPIGWIDWSRADEALVEFTAPPDRTAPPLLPLADSWYTGLPNDGSGLDDLQPWLRRTGADWNDDWAAASRASACASIGRAARRRPLLLLVNAGDRALRAAPRPLVELDRRADGRPQLLLDSAARLPAECAQRGAGSHRR